MAKFLTSAEISGVLEALVKEATQFIYIVSPYIKINENLFARLLNKSKTTKVIVIYGKDKNRNSELQVSKLENCKIYFNKNLHGKLYATEDKAVITSMNIYDYSQVNNIEFGIFITAKGDRKIYKSIINEIALLEESSESVFKVERSLNNDNTINKVNRTIDEGNIFMRDLYKELAKYKYKIGSMKNEVDGLYMAISRYALSIYKFDKNELYEDRSAVYRNTIISKELYENIKQHFLSLKIG